MMTQKQKELVFHYALLSWVDGGHESDKLNAVCCYAELSVFRLFGFLHDHSHDYLGDLKEVLAMTDEQFFEAFGRE